MSGDVKLEPCPFCGGPADIEEIAPKDAGGRNVSFSAGCRNMDGPDECIGQQSLLTFARKSDAAKAWNRRSSSAAERAVVEARREALEEAAKVVEPTNGPPCDCITLHDDEWWMPHCDCRNGGDSDEAQSWCTSKNEARRISALSSVRGEGGDKQARPSGSAHISTGTKDTTNA